MPCPQQKLGWRVKAAAAYFYCPVAEGRCAGWCRRDVRFTLCSSWYFSSNRNMLKAFKSFHVPVYLHKKLQIQEKIRQRMDLLEPLKSSSKGQILSLGERLVLEFSLVSVFTMSRLETLVDLNIYSHLFSLKTTPA